MGSYFEIWVWNASILVRVLVISSNTFSCCTRTKILNPTFTREINNTPDPTEYQQWLTCTATPKLLPSSILGTWSCTHIDTCHKKWNLYISMCNIHLFVSVQSYHCYYPHLKTVYIYWTLDKKKVKTTVTDFLDWPCWASPSVSGSEAWPPAGASLLARWWRWDHRAALVGKSSPNISHHIRKFWLSLAGLLSKGISFFFFFLIRTCTQNCLMLSLIIVGLLNFRVFG